jgi:hypothetical protein
MKATLEFDLPEDEESFMLCQKALVIDCRLGELIEHMRSIIKHTDRTPNSEAVYSLLCQIRDDPDRHLDYSKL